MASYIIEEGLREFNAKMEQQKHNVLLFFNSVTCHPCIQLSNVRLLWFFPNITNVSEPMNQGVIKCVKLIYNIFLMQSLLANMEITPSATQVAKSISVFYAVLDS
jgi:hypothetical protein